MNRLVLPAVGAGVGYLFSRGRMGPRWARDPLTAVALGAIAGLVVQRLAQPPAVLALPLAANVLPLRPGVVR